MAAAREASPSLRRRSATTWARQPAGQCCCSFGRISTLDACAQVDISDSGTGPPGRTTARPTERRPASCHGALRRLWWSLRTPPPRPPPPLSGVRFGPLRRRLRLLHFGCALRVSSALSSSSPISLEVMKSQNRLELFLPAWSFSSRQPLHSLWPPRPIWPARRHLRVLHHLVPVARHLFRSLDVVGGRSPHSSAAPSSRELQLASTPPLWLCDLQRVATADGVS